MLSSSDIDKLASRKGVKCIAVQNFLSSLHGGSAFEAYANLQLDTRLYKWNAATQSAIRKGIELHYK